MPRFVLHIGPHKTGSTHIQACLLHQRDALEKAGVHLASLWNASAAKPSHTGLVRRLTSETRHELQPVFDAWRNSDYDTILISCEDLSALSLEPVKLRMLRELTAESPVTIVYFVRRWTELLASSWQEYVKQGVALTFPEVLVHNLRDPARSRFINIDVCLGVFADIFGKDSIRLISYDSVTATGADICELFVNRLFGGLQMTSLADRGLNASLSPAKVELMRLFNCLERETGVASRQLLRFLMLEHPPAPMTALLDQLGEYVSTLELDDEDAPVRAVLLKNWQEYAACALPPVPDGRFYVPRRTEVSFVRSDYALKSGFAETLRQVWLNMLVMAAALHA